MIQMAIKKYIQNAQFIWINKSLKNFNYFYFCTNLFQIFQMHKWRYIFYRYIPSILSKKNYYLEWFRINIKLTLAVFCWSFTHKQLSFIYIALISDHLGHRPDCSGVDYCFDWWKVAAANQSTSLQRQRNVWDLSSR